MPIEIEYKYVLKFNSLEDELKSRNIPYYDIHQIYLEKGIRFRSLTDTALTKYEFTYKTKVDVGYLEINAKVSKFDFDIAVTKATTQLKKRRYLVYTQYHLWEIDFFYDDNGVYFCLMELEVEKGEIANLTELPDYIKEKLVKNVSLDDANYSSFKLSDRSYAEGLI